MLLLSKVFFTPYFPYFNLVSKIINNTKAVMRQSNDKNAE